MCAGSVRLTRRYHRLCLASLFATAATASRSPSKSFMALGSRCKHRPWIAARVSEQLCRPPNARDTEVSADLAAFSQELADNPAASGADRETQRHFASA